MNKSYGIFAEFYDALTSNVDYREKAEFIDSVAGKFGGRRGGVLLDLACGTGSLSEQLDSLGYDVIAVDSSPDMLTVAMDKKFESGRNIQYVCQDMRELDLFGAVDIAVCNLDSLNHLDNIEDVRRVFEKVFLFCEHGGLFIFDINTEYKHKTILGDNTFVYDTDDVYCVWQNSCEGSRVKIELDFFVPEDAERYTRYSESFYENAYPLCEIEKLLTETGFEILMCCDSENGGNVSETTQRAAYAVRKP